MDFDSDTELATCPALLYGPKRGRGCTKRARDPSDDAEALRPRPAKVARVTKSPKAPISAKPRSARRPAPAWELPEQEVEKYRQMLERGALLLGQLAPHTWVAEVYNITHGHRLDGRAAWTHVTAVRDENMGLVFDCTNCKQFKQHKKCVHTLLLLQDAYETLIFSETYDPPCILFKHTPPDPEGKSSSFFSVSCTSQGRRGRRCIVTRHGTSATGSTWECGACTHAHACQHIKASKDTLIRLDVLPESHGGRDASCHADAEDERREFQPLPAYADLKAQETLAKERCVSWDKAGLPPWARIKPEDDKVAGPYCYVRPLPNDLPLEGDAHCRCGAFANRESQLYEMDCTVYDDTGAFRATIEVRRCSRCPGQSRMMAGPDLGALGLFNYNNTTIVSHTLLNKYDSMANSGVEATYHGFCKFMQQEYTSSGCAVPFMGEDRFRRCWFSFMGIQECGDDYKCDECGEEPRTVLVDGVTIGYPKCKQTSTLRPPTHAHRFSAIRHTIRTPKEPIQLVGDAKLRRRAIALIRWALPGGKTAFEKEDMSVDRDQIDEAPPAQGRRKKSAADPPEPVSPVARKLRKVNQDLGDAFEKYVPHAKLSRVEQNVRRLWLELLLQLVAHESVAQFAPHRCWHELQALKKGGLKRSTEEALTHRLLASMPALALVLQVGQAADRKGYPEEKATGMRLVDWIFDHCIQAWGQLKREDPEPPDEDKFKGDDWRETGCFYSMPQIRARPKYPGLRTDGKIDRNMVSGQDGIGCSKFFAEYSKKGYTGGILAFWCVHGICYGFHCIPDGEGRNDAFSALYTRWRTAPKVVIYDFACALGPYCMMREAEFFKDTVFIIDRFHSSGHKSCSPACFASNYAFDVDIRNANTSAAEFGNSGLKRIRLPVRYMTQRHAIVYIHRFLSLWNRSRRIKLAATN